VRTCAVFASSLIAGLISACSWLPSSDKGDYPTIGQLQRPELPRPSGTDSPQARSAAMQHYQAFLDETPDYEFVPEAVRRLADLHLEQEQEELVQADGPLPNKQSRAAQLYAELLHRFPDHHRNDSALYQLARAHEQRGDLEPAMQALTDYTKQFPAGAKYDEAQFRRGEYLFVRRQYDEAGSAYQAVLDQGPESPFHQHALYKMGWTRFKQNRHEAALDAYIQLLDETIGDHDSAALPPGLGAAEQERLDDTLRAVSLSFSSLGGAQQVSTYFRSNGSRAYEPLLYAKLATLYLTKERFTDAADSYRLFADVHPHHRDAPLFQSRVIDVYKKAGFGEQVLQQKEAFVELYQPASEYWKQHDPAQAPEVLTQVQRHLRDIAQHYHALAQQQPAPDAYARAGHWYQLYLQAFADSEQAPYMNFLYAELLTSAGNHGDAAAQYERTAYSYGAHEKAAEAGYAALLAYQKHEKALSGQAGAEWRMAGLKSALRFSDQFPDHRQAIPVRTRAAQELYALKEYAAASETAEVVTTSRDAPAELQLAAWTVIAHAQFELADYHRSEAAYQQVLSRTASGAPERGRHEEKLAASIYKQGEQARTAGDLASAATHFLRIRDAVPASPINVTAQYDAAAAYIALRRWPDAIAILEDWRRSNSGHGLEPEVTRKLAVLYKENDQPLLAASEFARIADTESDPLLQREAAWTAAGLYERAGQTTEAITAYQRFVEKFPNPVEQAMEARLQLVSLHEKAGDAATQRYWQQQIVAADRAAGAQRSDRTRYLAAHARLALATSDLDRYRTVKLIEPLKRNLATKKDLMQTTLTGFTEAAAYQVADVTTQATFLIGELYADFSRALMQSERPSNLNAEELEQYDILLEEQAYPFEEKAIEVHETNTLRIASGVYDHWTRRSMASLAVLMPVRYAKQEEGESFVAVLQ
jgi:TolA-binding protein